MQKAACIPSLTRGLVQVTHRSVQSHRRLWMVLGITVIMYVLCPWRIGVVMGESMSPSLHAGQIYVLDISYYRRQPLARGDIIVFRHGRDIMTKRVYAVPGDTVTVVRHEDESDDDLLQSPLQISRLERLVNSPYFIDTFCLVRLRVPEGSCYVLGDHEDSSYDSRGFGLLPIDQVLGKMVLPAQPARTTRG